MFSPNQDLIDTISSVNQDDSVLTTSKNYSKRMANKKGRFHQPTLRINDQEILSPQHFKMKTTGQRGNIMESQIPLDVKFSIVYDDGLEDDDLDSTIQPEITEKELSLKSPQY